jgi:sensor histidine kinase regulating citrate/malate metabolism
MNINKRQKRLVILKTKEGRIDWKLFLANDIEVNKFKSQLVEKQEYEDALFFNEDFMNNLTSIWLDTKGWDNLNKLVEQVYFN